MHTFNESTAGAGVPAFLAKLWRLVEDSETDNLICWRSDGRSFIIQNQAQFARELLPLNYKHNNMASFIRQLNMYGFHKITNIENGGLKFDKDEMEFSHPCFQKDQPYLLEHIKRKIANPKSAVEEKGSIKPEAVNKVMNEVKSMRGRQDTLDSRFSAMKQENEALWREIAVLRQKHAKQQQIVNKLIQFLVTIVQPSRPNSGINNMAGVKRRYQLMIDNVPESQSQSAKMQKRTEQAAGPIIHELNEEVYDDDHNYSIDEIIATPSNIKSPLSAMSFDNNGISPKTFKVEQNDVQYVEHPESDSELIEESVDDGNISYIINEIVPDNTWIDNSNQLSSELSNVAAADAPTVDQTSTSFEQNYQPIIINTPLNLTNNTKQGGGKSVLNSNGKTVVNNNNNGKKLDKKKKPILYLKTNDGRKAKVGEKVVQSNVLNKNKLQTHQQSLQGNNNLQKNDTITTQSSCASGSGINNIGSGKNSKIYKDKNDFISTEMPNELFDSQDGSMSPLSTFLNSPSGSFNQTLSDDYSKKLKSPNGNVVGASTSGDKTANMALTKYNDNYRMDTALANSSIKSTNDILKMERDDVSTHLDTMQNDLDSIKDFFKSDDYTLDHNSFMGNSSGGSSTKNRLVLSPSVDNELFSKIFGDLEAPYELSLNPDFCLDKRADGNNLSGSELMTYQPINTMDLSEFLNPASPCQENDASKELDDDDFSNSAELHTPLVDKKKISFKTK